MHRRSVLATASIALSAVALPSPIAADDAGTEYERSEPVRAESGVELEAEDEEHDEHVDYLEDGDQVRYVMAWVGAEPDGGDNDADEPPEREPQYATTDWERWAERRCRSIAAEAAAEHVEAELESRGDGVAVLAEISSRVPGDDSGAVVAVADRNAETELTIDDVAAVAPATVDATYALEDRTFDAEVPIFARLERGIPEPDYDGGELDHDEPTDEPGTESNDLRRSEQNDASERIDSVSGFGSLAALGAVGSALGVRLTGSRDSDSKTPRE